MEYSELKRKGRKLLEAGALEECYKMFEEALRINPSDARIRQKVDTLREALNDQTEEDNDPEMQQLNAEMVEVCPDYFLHNKIYSKLFDYQRDGLKWMYSLFLRRKGGVLGDDMGLGKTIQVISFLAGLYDMEKISSVLLVMPVSLIGNWLSEFEKWAPGINVFDHHAGTNREKEVSLRKVMNRGGVILTTYGMVTTRYEELCQRGGRNFVWDYVVLDEGHRIKNPTKTQKAVFGLLAKHRLVLTGTAVQNNLRELWSLFHFTHQGTLFGNLAGFKQDFEGPINRGREKDAKAGEREMGVQLALQLKKMIQPFFLRRTKAEVLHSGQGMKLKAKKEDLVLWTFLSETQQQLYQDFLQSDAVKEILMSSKSPLLQLNILKKICDHPRLLPKKACVQLGLCDTMTEDEIRDFLEDNKHCPFSIDDVSDEDLLNESGKMRLTLELTSRLRSEGHRTLIFSTSRRILDMIQRILRMRKFTIARLDGTITKHTERHDIVTDFQKRGKDVFLLTTQVGGVGLTLTNADRVIIYDPNWNPATDAQAVDRAFRIGQTKDVYVYRLITCGTIEEKIYSRQVFKDSIIKQTTGKYADPTRYFTRSQLRELFVLNDTRRSQTQEKLSEMHEKHLSGDVKDHIKALMATNMIFGVSHHDLLFSTEEEKEDVSEDQRRFITQQVERARVIREREADVVAEDLQRNPHMVPNLDMKSASSRNRAAAMPSTVNPENLRDRPTMPPKLNKFEDQSESDADVSVGQSSRSFGKNETFIDLSEDDYQDHKLPKHLHSTIIEDASGANEPIIVDDDDDDISIIKETKREFGEVTVIDDSDDEFKIEDVTPRNVTNGHDAQGGNASRVKSPPARSQTEEQRSRRSGLCLPARSPVRPRRGGNERGDDVSEDDDSPIMLNGRTRRLEIVSDDEEDDSAADLRASVAQEAIERSDNSLGGQQRNDPASGAAEDQDNEGLDYAANAANAVRPRALTEAENVEGPQVAPHAAVDQPLPFDRNGKALKIETEVKPKTELKFKPKVELKTKQEAEPEGKPTVGHKAEPKPDPQVDPLTADQGSCNRSLPGIDSTPSSALLLPASRDNTANIGSATPCARRSPSAHVASSDGNRAEFQTAATSRRSSLLSFRAKNTKRRSVAVIRREASESPEPDDGPIDANRGDHRADGSSTAGVDDQEARLRAAEEAAYDEAFEADDVDESIIEKTILEASMPLSESEGCHNSKGTADKSWKDNDSESASQAAESAENDISMIVEDSFVEEDNDDDMVVDRNERLQTVDGSMADDDDVSAIEDSDEDL